MQKRAKLKWQYDAKPCIGSKVTPPAQLIWMAVLSTGGYN